MIPDDSLILIGAAILLQLGLWWRVHLALMRIEARLDDQDTEDHLQRLDEYVQRQFTWMAREMTDLANRIKDLEARKEEP